MMRRGLPDLDKLEEALRAVAYASRLELLHALRLPKASSEIRITARQTREGMSADRWMARQSVDVHLQRLEEAGLVTAQEGEGRRMYVLNGPRLYQIIEDFRSVGHIAVGTGASASETATLDEARPPVLPSGPHLVVVHGLIEGRSFPLQPGMADAKGRWIVGRRKGVSVCLDYDPFLSNENSEVTQQGDEFHLADLESSRNGTFLNWRELDRGERAKLSPGDIIGVGRSVLVFRDPR